MVKRLEGKLKKARIKAMSRDAMEGPNPQKQTGSWVTSRRRGGTYPDTRIT